jgi:hypothetical protein
MFGGGVVILILLSNSIINNSHKRSRFGDLGCSTFGNFLRKRYIIYNIIMAH